VNILYLTPHVPNPTKIRAHFHVRGLREAGHQVTVATVERGADDAQHVQSLRDQGVTVLSAKVGKITMAANALTVLPSRLPLQSQLLWSEALWRTIQSHVRANPPDIIHVEHLRMARYGLRLTQDWPVLWDAVDYLSALYRQAARSSRNLPLRLISRLEAPRLAAYERWLTGQFAATIVISSNDLALFQAANPVASRVHLALTGVPITSVPAIETRARKTLIITGTLNYHPNVASVLYFVNEILPLIRRDEPDIQLQLVGANPVGAVQALASDQIEVTGFVPSITDYLGQATIALAPVVYGSGMQIKVLEAFLTGTPLVATEVALRGLDVRHKEHVLVADTPADFASAVLRLLADPDLRARLGAAGRRYVEQHHDLRATTARLVEIYQRVIAGVHDF